MLKEKDKKELQKVFKELDQPVKLIMFSQEIECQYCQVTREMVEEVAELSDKITVEILDFVADKARAEALGIDKAPAIIVMGNKDYGIRFYGVPGGYEFNTFIESIVDVSRGKHGLSEGVVSELAKVDQPVRMQVMISPT